MSPPVASSAETIMEGETLPAWLSGRNFLGQGVSGSNTQEGTILQQSEDIIHHPINPRFANTLSSNGRKQKKVLVSHVQITPMQPKADDIINIGMIFSLHAIRGSTGIYELRCEVLEGSGSCPVPQGRFPIGEHGQLKHAGGNTIKAAPGVYRITIFTAPYEQPSWETILRVQPNTRHSSSPLK